jgi:hypothetical protein
MFKYKNIYLNTAISKLRIKMLMKSMWKASNTWVTVASDTAAVDELELDMIPTWTVVLDV